MTTKIEVIKIHMRNYNNLDTKDKDYKVSESLYRRILKNLDVKVIRPKFDRKDNLIKAGYIL